MARKGHKEDCMCAVCKALKTKAAREQAEPIVEGIVQPVVAVEGITLDSLPIGAKFRYRAAVYQKIYQMSGHITVIDPAIDDVQITLNPQTIVEPLGPGHEVEGDM